MTTRLWLALTLSIACTSDPIAMAEAIRIGASPTGGGRAAGFTMTIEVEAVGGNGYHPVHLDFKSVGLQFNRDRNLEVELTPGHSYLADMRFGVRYPLVLPEARGQKRFTVYVPHYFTWDRMAVRIYEDGREIDFSHVSFGLNGLRPRFANQKTTVGILTPASQTGRNSSGVPFPDVRTLVTVLGDGPIPETQINIPRLNQGQAEQLARRVQPAWVQFRPIEENALPESWLGYSQLDILIVAAPMLDRIEDTSPVRFAAMTDWLSAGGTLWVHAAGNEPLSSLQTLALSKPPTAIVLAEDKVVNQLGLQQPNDTTELTYEPWNGVQKLSQNYSFRTRNQAMSSRSAALARLKSAEHPFATIVPANKIAERFRVAAYGYGLVVAIDDDDPFPGSFQFWQSVKRISNERGRLQWTDRNGVDVPAGNDNYWTWLIESVGQPPVKSFVFLNTLFVIVIGPVGYFAFRRRERLYLLYFFAPALAFLVTASLFSYALIADGIRTQAKIRRITWIDFQNDCAVSQSRETYYAVLGSSKGLEYPSDAMILPVLNQPVTDRYYGRRNRSSRSGEIRFGPESQIFRGRFLPPRDQVQYLVTRPHRGSVMLSLNLGGDTGRVTNRLPTPLKQIIVHDREGRWWVGEDIPAGGESLLDSASAADDAVTLGSPNDSSQVVEFVPALGVVPKLQYRGWGSISPGTQLSSLENQLRDWSKHLPLNAFIATAQITEDQVAADDAVVIGSFHVLMGELP